MASEQKLSEPQWSMGPGPYVFSGTPPICEGMLPLMNETGERVRIRPIPVAKLDRPAGQGPPVGRIQVSARLEPHSRLLSPARLFVGDFTPPGTYSGEITVGGRQEKITIHVLEKSDLSLSPRVLHLEAKGGATVTKAVVVTNHGNMPSVLPEVALLPLGAKGGASLLFHAAILEKGKEGYEQVLDNFVGRMAESEAGPCRVVFKPAGSAEIAPGESRPVELEIRLPAELIKHRTYRGVLALRNARLILEVVSQGPADTGRQKGK
jgi:hypothetical protein